MRERFTAVLVRAAKEAKVHTLEDAQTWAKREGTKDDTLNVYTRGSQLVFTAVVEALRERN